MNKKAEPNIKILRNLENDSSWQLTVQVSDENSTTEHLVTIPKMTYNRLTGGKISPEGLAIRSFEFLLERETKESILPEFEIEVISKYFPEWEKEVTI